MERREWPRIHSQQEGGLASDGHCAMIQARVEQWGKKFLRPSSNPDEDKIVSFERLRGNEVNFSHGRAWAELSLLFQIVNDSCVRTTENSNASFT